MPCGILRTNVLICAISPPLGSKMTTWMIQLASLHRLDFKAVKVSVKSMPQSWLNDVYSGSGVVSRYLCFCRCHDASELCVSCAQAADSAPWATSRRALPKARLQDVSQPGAFFPRTMRGAWFGSGVLQAPHSAQVSSCLSWGGRIHRSNQNMEGPGGP